MTKSRGILPPRRRWQPWQLEALRVFYPHWRSDWIAMALGRELKSVYTMAANLGIGKSDVYLNSPEANRLRHGDTRGIGSRFAKGNVPWSAGKKTGLRGRSAETTFKSGLVPHNHLPVGTLNADSQGYMKVKLREPNVWGYYAQLVWASTHPWPLPSDTVLRYRDGDRGNCHPDNLVLATRAEVVAANQFHHWPEEIKQLIYARRSLVRKIHDHEQDRGRTKRAVRADGTTGGSGEPRSRDRAVEGDG